MVGTCLGENCEEKFVPAVLLALNSVSKLMPTLAAEISGFTGVCFISAVFGVIAKKETGFIDGSEELTLDVDADTDDVDV